MEYYIGTSCQTQWQRLKLASGDVGANLTMGQLVNYRIASLSNYLISHLPLPTY